MYNQWTIPTHVGFSYAISTKHVLNQYRSCALRFSGNSCHLEDVGWSLPVLPAFNSDPCSLSNQQCFWWWVSPSGSSTVPARRQITSNAVYPVLIGRTAILLWRATAQCDCFNGFLRRVSGWSSRKRFVLNHNNVAVILHPVPECGLGYCFAAVHPVFARELSTPVRHYLKLYSSFSNWSIKFWLLRSKTSCCWAM